MSWETVKDESTCSEQIQKERHKTSCLCLQKLNGIVNGRNNKAEDPDHENST